MAEEKKSCCESKKWRGTQNNASGGAVYGIGLFGALIYYIQSSTSFWDGVIGVLKALVWPAMLVYNLFSFLGM